LLTAPAVIASWSRDQDTAPMTRGKNLLQRVLCQTLPPPPAELKVTAIPQLATATTRQRYEAHVSDPACSGCHAPLDAVAFALEHFDSVGRYRDSEQGLAIDASGALSGGDFAGSFADVRELGQRLAASQDARGCLSRHYARFAIGGGQAGDDECLVERMTQAAALQGDSAPALLLALVTSDSFRRRRLPE
jgi:hypothetical protein